MAGQRNTWPRYQSSSPLPEDPVLEYGKGCLLSPGQPVGHASEIFTVRLCRSTNRLFSLLMHG